MPQQRQRGYAFGLAQELVAQRRLVQPQPIGRRNPRQERRQGLVVAGRKDAR